VDEKGFMTLGLGGVKNVKIQVENEERPAAISAVRWQHGLKKKNQHLCCENLRG
jgi:hypothetical protein